MTGITLLAVLICAGILTAVTPCPAQTDRDAVLDWVAEQAIELNTFRPGGDASDLVALDEIVGDARVVLLGDSRHDAREQWLLKHRFIEHLVTERGFSVLAMEESLPCTAPLNACLFGLRDDMGVALNEMGSWYIWDAEEMLAVMTMLRAHNESVTDGPKAVVLGFDMSDGARRGVDEALALLGRVDSAAAEDLRVAIDLTPFSEDFWPQSMRNFGSLAPETIDALGAGLSTLVDTVGARKTELIAGVGEQEYEWALRQAIVARQACEMMCAMAGDTFEEAGMARERAMAENLAWILQIAAPEAKIIVWAHNFHVARARQHIEIPNRPAVTMDPLGALLDEAFGDSMVSIGFSFERGTEASGLEPAPDDWVDGVLAAAGPDVFLLDLREAPREGPVGEWLNAEQSLRGEGGRVLLTPADAYDALAFVREVGTITRTARAAARFGSLGGR